MVLLILLWAAHSATAFACHHSGRVEDFYHVGRTQAMSVTRQDQKMWSEQGGWS